MGKKLLVITAGTIAAGVGQTLVKQMNAHPGSALTVLVRYIDTAYLPDRYSDLRPGEWFQLSIDPRYMSAIYDKRQYYPTIDSMLYDGLLPGTDVMGGGSIRYNGAGAVEVRRNDLLRWLSSSMTELARADDGDTNISIALIISAVGATGSGSMEHLINVIIDAARFAKIRSNSQGTIRCDVYILQPSQDVTDLGLANTLALYSEMAASQLIGDNRRNYQGRKIIIDWGSIKALKSIEQLKEVAAAIIRLSSDPSSAFAAEYQERQVDNHVLRELDPITHLPMHLSLATVVTINLGRLKEQVVQRDVERLVNSLVFDASPTGSSSNVLLGRFADTLSGETPEDRYQQLLNYLTEPIHIEETHRRIDTTLNSRSIPNGEKGSKLSSIWQLSKTEITLSRHRIDDYARSFISSALRALHDAKSDRICHSNVSLTELREEYRSLEQTLQSVLEVARAELNNSVDDLSVTRQLRTLEGIWPFRLLNRRSKLRRLANTMKTNLDQHLQATARASAIKALEELAKYCAEIGRNLDIVLNKLRKQRDDQRRHFGTTSEFSLENGNPLNISALPSLEEMKTYAAQVSVFTSEENGPEQLAEFRQWIQGRPELEELFKGNLDQLQGVITRYTTDKVGEAMKEHSILEVLRRAGPDTLRQRLTQAAEKATSLVSYSESFAPHRREAWHVSAYYKTPDERKEIESAIDKAFAQGRCKLLPSLDPTEVAVFYYVDGIPMSALDDMKGRCLDAFLNRRMQWQQQKELLSANAPLSSINSKNQRVGVPIFSGRDAEQRVLATEIIRKVWDVRGEEVGDFRPEDIPELNRHIVLEPHSNGNGKVNGMTDLNAVIHSTDQLSGNTIVHATAEPAGNGTTETTPEAKGTGNNA